VIQVLASFTSTELPSISVIKIFLFSQTSLNKGKSIGMRKKIGGQIKFVDKVGYL
jgi:hypothetical protein